MTAPRRDGAASVGVTGRRRGFVTRVRDETDRRRVFVRSTGQHEAEVARLFAPLSEASHEILGQHDAAQLELVVDFVTRLNAANRRIFDSGH